MNVIVEVIIVILSVITAVQKRKKIGWIIAIVFLLYILYDYGRLNAGSLGFSGDLLAFMLLLGSVLMAYAVWLLYRGK